MFDEIIDPSLGVYVVTASNPTESSWGVNCPPYDLVRGRPIGSCLGDLFAVSWMNDTLAASPSETLQSQFEASRDRVAQGSGGLYPHSSHVMQYGDVSVATELVAAFQGTGSATPAASQREGVVASRDVPLHLAYYRYLRADSAARLAAGEALRAQVAARLAADALFLGWATDATGDAALAEELAAARPNGPALCGSCCRLVHERVRESCGGYDDYSLQYGRLVANLCAYSGGDGTSLGAALLARCTGGSALV